MDIRGDPVEKALALSNLAREPYRLLFPVSMALGLGLVVAWGLALAGAGPALTPPLHGLLFAWGFLGTAVLGFLLTAYPRQNDAPQPPFGWVVLAAALQVAFVLLGLAGQGPAAASLGGAVWLGATLWAARIALPSLRRKWDATTAGAPLALAAATAGISLWPWQPALAADLAILGFLVPLALLLLDRVLPFFSGKKVEGYAGGRKPGFLLALALGTAVRLALSHQALAVVAADLFLAATVLRQFAGWRPDQCYRVPLIGILHLGIAWIAAGYLLDAALVFIGGSPGLLARHAWTLGGMTTLLIGIAVRVVRGHGGLGLRLGWDGALVAGLVQGAVLLRVVPPLLGQHDPTLVYAVPSVLLGSALLLWLARLGPGCLRG